MQKSTVMENLDLLILDVCYEYYQEGHFTIDGDDLAERLKRLCFDNFDNVAARIGYLWENNYLESSNDRYYLTDRSLELLKKIKQSGMLKS